jgi:galactose-1-phosphate uridylyltransferase
MKTPDKINEEKLVKKYNKHDGRCPFCKESDPDVNKTSL